VFRNLAAFRRLSGHERRLLLSALALLPLAQVAARLLPLPKLIALFHLQSSTASAEAACRTACLPEHLAAVMAMRKIFGVIDRKFSFWPGKCLAQALVARFFLRRQGIPCLLILGAKQSARLSGADEPPSLRAHAWLKAGGVAVTGDGARDYIPVAFFL